MEKIKCFWLFREMIDLLTILGKDEDLRAKLIKGSRILANSSQRLDNRMREELTLLDPRLGDYLEEVSNKGKINDLEKLKEAIPKGLREILTIPDITPRMVSEIFANLNIKSLQDIGVAAKKKKIRMIEGMSSKTELTILRGITLLSKGGSMPLGLAMPLAQELKNVLSIVDNALEICITGDLRRGKEMLSEIILVVKTNNADSILDLVKYHPHLELVDEKSFYIECNHTLGVKIKVFAVTENYYWHTIVKTTGNNEHYEALKKRAFDKGLSWPINAADSEENIYHQVGLSYIYPELREGKGEIEAGYNNSLPDLLDIENYLGDLHIHTNWSDGISSINEMVQEARRKEYKYLAFTDHSQSLKVAHGLTKKQWEEQAQEVAGTRKEYPDIKILHGLEVDILTDGSLDYYDDFLEQMDIVIASIHTGFNQSKEVITSRMESAIKNPNVDILAHPTGRILGKRSGYEVDLERIMEIAAKTETALEINSSPDRLDLSPENAKMAKDLGINIAINTDAHDPIRLDDIMYGVKCARRAWLETDDVINCWPYEKLNDFLSKKKG